MQIEKMNIEDIIPYENNAKLHPKEQIKQIVSSIRQFGNNDPIAIDANNVVIEGHGRLLALKELGYEEVEVIRLGHLTEEQRKAYTLVHNKLTMNSGFDLEILEIELGEILNIDMAEFDFDLDFPDEDENAIYTNRIEAPFYEPTGEAVSLNDLVDKSKRDELEREILEADIPEEIQDFLIEASQRHLVFNYRNVAEYYSNASKEVQELFERSGLVIIDFDKAIELGYVALTNSIADMLEGGE